MPYDRGTVTRICSPHLVGDDGISRHVKDVHPVHGKNNTASEPVTLLDPSDDETNLMVYEAAEENSSVISAFVGLR